MIGWTLLAVSMFIAGLQLGEMREYNRVNEVITVVQNPNCLDGRMK